MTKKPDDKAIARQPSKEELAAMLRKLDYSASVTGAVFGSDLRKVVGNEGAAAALAGPYAQDLIERFGPRDPVEEMMVSQMVVTHGRLLQLTSMAVNQTNLKWAQLMNDAADRASNTFRRLVLALADYRNPRRGNSFTAIGQQNVAGQQIVNPPAPVSPKESSSPGERAAPALEAPVVKPDVAGSPVPPAKEEVGRRI